MDKTAGLEPAAADHIDDGGGAEYAHHYSIAISLKRIADALESRPLVQRVTLPVGSSGQIVGDVAKWTTPVRKVSDKWRTKWDCQPSGQPVGLNDHTVVRIQTDNAPDHVETHRAGDADWRNVIAYQLINQE